MNIGKKVSNYLQIIANIFVYGLHWDAVISRWARVHASRACERGRCPRRYKKIFTYANFSDMKIFLYTLYINRAKKVEYM